MISHRRVSFTTIFKSGIVQPDAKLETVEGAGGASFAPASACEIKRVHGEWRFVVRCDANDVCLEQGNRASSWPAGAALAEARRSTYPEFGRASRCRLVVLGIEVGGRWSAEAANFVRLLALQRAATIAAFVGRWSGLLSVAAARSFAASLLSLPISNTANVDGESPLLSDVLADTAESPPLASRLA
eukprot:s7562_g1.t1